MVVFKEVPEVIKMVVQAKNLEDGVTVTKRTGQKEYKIKRSIKIYGDNRKEIKCDVDNIFLVDAEGNLTQIKETTELLAHISTDTLFYELEQHNYYDDEHK